MTHLERIEAGSIYILRKAFSQINPLAMLWSLGGHAGIQKMCRRLVQDLLEQRAYDLVYCTKGL